MVTIKTQEETLDESSHIFRAGQCEQLRRTHLAMLDWIESLLDLSDGPSTTPRFASQEEWYQALQKADEVFFQSLTQPVSCTSCGLSPEHQAVRPLGDLHCLA